MNKSNSRKRLLMTWLSDVLNHRDFKIDYASEDASFRTYYRLTDDIGTQIIMDAPPNYESTVTFINIAENLKEIGVHAPHIYQKNTKLGFLLLEDLGKTDYLSALSHETVNSLYERAIKTIKTMQEIKDNMIPRYGEELLSDEIDLFEHWLLSKHLQLDLKKKQLDSLILVKQALVKSAISQPTTFVHRDYHSRNLMVTEDNNPGVIDFQDAVNGPITYDLVSLLKDCYIKWTKEEIYSWVDYYRSIQSLVEDIPRDQFIKWFDLMGVQRHLKAIGIFARLNHRDDKPGYLKDIPRTLSYITDIAPKYKETQPLMTLIDELDIVNRVEA